MVKGENAHRQRHDCASAPAPLMLVGRRSSFLLMPTLVCAAQQGRPDILAAGYGQHAFGAPGGGLIALWSLKNPGSPLWLAATGAGVASLDWAAEAAGLLAVGMLDGTVAVYDARSRQVCCKVLGFKIWTAGLLAEGLLDGMVAVCDGRSRQVSCQMIRLRH